MSVALALRLLKNLEWYVERRDVAWGRFYEALPGAHPTVLRDYLRRWEQLYDMVEDLVRQLERTGLATFPRGPVKG